MAESSAESATSLDQSNSALLWLAVLGIAGTLLFFNLGSYSTLGLTEGYVGVPAREMLITGHWLVPRFAGEPRLEKPPLAYWLVAALGKITGGVSEFTVRAPSALAGLLLVLLVGRWGTRWYGVRAGLATAAIQATSVYTLHWARLGVVDVILTLLTTTALYLAAPRPEPPLGISPAKSANSLQRPVSRWLFIYFVLGVAGWVKPVIGPLLVLLTCGGFLAIERRYAELLAMANPVAILMCAALALAWPFLVSRQIPEIWPLWTAETIGRGLGSRRYNQPIWFYAGELLWMTLPWTPLLLIALPQSWRRAWQKGDARERFLWVWWLGQVVSLSLSAGKKSYYILPALPALSLIAGQKLADLSMRFNAPHMRRRTAAGRLFIALLFVLSIAYAAVRLIKQWPDLSYAWSAIALASALGAVLAAWFVTAGRRALALFTGGFVFLVSTLIVYGRLYPYFDNRGGAAELSRSVATMVPAVEEITLIAPNRSPLIFYIRPPVRLERSAAEIKSQLSLAETIYVVGDAAAVMELREFGQVDVLQNIQLAKHSGVSATKEVGIVKLSAMPRNIP